MATICVRRDPSRALLDPARQRTLFSLPKLCELIGEMERLGKKNIAAVMV
jgi:hypothetical protein